MTVTSWVRTALNRKIVLSRGMCSRGLCPYRLWGSQGSQVAAFKILLEEKSGTMGSYSMLERFEGSRALSILQRLSSKKRFLWGSLLRKSGHAQPSAVSQEFRQTLYPVEQPDSHLGWQSPNRRWTTPWTPSCLGINVTH